MKFNAMFQPINIGPMTVKNRFVVPPMGNNFANTDGSMSEQSAAYYRERAKGGFGLITIEATVVHKGAKGGPRKPCLYDDSTIESFRKVVMPVMQREQRFPYSFRMQVLKEMQRTQVHRSRQLQAFRQTVEEIHQRKLRLKKFMNW